MPLICSFSRIADASSSIPRMNRYGDNGSPWLTPRSILKEAQLITLFITQLLRTVAMAKVVRHLGPHLGFYQKIILRKTVTYFMKLVENMSLQPQIEI